MGISNLVSRLRTNPLSCTAVLSTFDNSFYYVGQVLHQPGSRSANFSFLLPDFTSGGEKLDVLVEYLCTQAGEMGALNILTEIEESHALFSLLRAVGFSVISWESIWQLPQQWTESNSSVNWLVPSPTDENSIRSLFQTLVPPLVQNATPYTNGHTRRVIYKNNCDILAYVEIQEGSQGIFLTPVIHPSVENVPALLGGLSRYFQSPGRPVYLQVRSYQAWLSEALQRVQAESSPRFALLVKHLAVGNHNLVKQAQRVRADARQAEPTSPIVQTYQEVQPSPKATK